MTLMLIFCTYRWQKMCNKQHSMFRARYAELIFLREDLNLDPVTHLPPCIQLSEGFKSAFVSLGTDPSSLTKGLASWWVSLDPPSQPKRNEMQERVQASSKVKGESYNLSPLWI